MHAGRALPSPASPQPTVSSLHLPRLMSGVLRESADPQACLQRPVRPKADIAGIAGFIQAADVWGI